MHELSRDDVIVYVGSGLFAVLLFVFGVGLLVATTPVELTRGRLAWFVGGFFLYTSVYVIAMGIYHGINRAEGS